MNRARVLLAALIAALVVLTSPAGADRLTLASFPISALGNGSSATITSGTNTGISGAALWTMAAKAKLGAPIPAAQTLAFIGASGSGNGAYLQVASGVPSVLVAGGTVRAASNAVSAGGWHEYVANYDGTNVNLYIDGALAASGTPGVAPTITNSKLYVFANYGGFSPFLGSANDIRLWSGVALSATQASAMYSSQAPPTSGLIRRYLLTDGTTTRVNAPLLAGIASRWVRYLATSVAVFSDQHSLTPIGLWSL